MRRETGYRRRRRGACNDGPVEYLDRWPAALIGSTAHASFGRYHGRHERDRRAHRDLRRYRHRDPGYRLRLYECCRRYGDDSTRHLPVGIDDIGHVRIVVIVVDHGRVDDGVAAIDILEVTAAHSIRRPIDFARPEWEPGNATDVAAGNRQLKIISTDKRYQCRRVVSPCALRAGNPAPGAAQICPAAVVGDRVTPWRVVHPGPTPGIDPRPMSVAIRCPANGNAIRIPDVAVVCVVAPNTIGIQIFIADHVLRNVTRRGRAIVAAVAIIRPAIKFILTRHVYVIVGA